MNSRTTHKPMSRRCAAAGVRARMQVVQRGGSFVGVQLLAAVDPHASDPDEGVVM